MPNSEQETKNNSKDKKINVICWIIYSFLGVSVLFAILMAFVFCYWDTLEHSGLFGDTFGSINAFFSALAFAGVRLSPRLDNFYEKIGVKTLGLLYPTVCRLQVPK